MQGEMLMAKTAQQTANPHASCEANQFKENGYLVNLADGQKMQVATTMTVDDYSEAQRLQVNPSRLGPSRRDSKAAGYRHEEGGNDDESRPLPVLVEGKAIDLLELCTEVLSHGGYKKVTDNSLWSFISNRLGFGLNGGPAVKLVYAKYLKNLDTKNKMPKNGLHQNVECWVAKCEKESPMGMPDCNLAGSGSTLQENDIETPSKRRRLSYLKEDPASSSYPECKLPTSAGNSPFVGMVEWLRRLALSPGDPRKGQGLRGSKQNETWVEECETMVMKARAVLWGRKELIYYGSLAGNVAKQKIPPAVYYKELPKPNTRTLEKLRANQTRAMKCGLHLPTDAMDARPTWLSRTPGQIFGAGSGQTIEPGLNLSSEYVKSMNEALSIGYLLNNNASRKRIPIGGHFQAHIPPWTGKVPQEREGSPCTDDQSCSLLSELFSGVRVWPLSDSNIASDIVNVGKGRPLQCACARPMSIECVKMHVAEEKERLKGELGEAFNSWGFDDMGESVATRWTDKEEHAFNAAVRMNLSSMGKNFWDELPSALPLKTVKELVSYYFNVFVVRRRAIENRIMPDSIDSDDDERELLVSESFSTFGKNARVDFGTRVGPMPNLSFPPHETSATVTSIATRWLPYGEGT